MSDSKPPSELASANELGDVVDDLEREIATFRRFREGLTSEGGEKPADEIAGSSATA